MRASLKIVVFSLVAVSAYLLLPSRALHAQTTPSPPPQSPPEFARLTMIVANQTNHSVDDVRQEDIQLMEDKLTQAISSFSKDVRPVDYALVLDTSGSFKPLLQPVVEAAKILINRNQAEDETFIESFVSSATIETNQEFTADKAKLSAALDSLYIRGGQSAVIDAVYLAIKHTAEYKDGPAERRRAVVLFTDGEDRASYYGSDQLIKLLREKDVQVFVIGIVNQLARDGGLIRKSPREAAERLLHRIAEESGGRVFFPKDVKELSEATAEIAHDLHFQYLIGFERHGKPGEKGFRKLKVTVADTPGREKLTVITRPGYFVNVQTSVQKANEKKSP
ncbi:MAG: VWA domain-containing protein [Pyrinomonadaceae bacterium]